MAKGMSRVARRLDRLEAQLGGDGEGDDWGPQVLVTYTRHWRSARTPGDQDEAEQTLPASASASPRQEQAAIHAAVDRLRDEARERRYVLGIVTARVGEDGQVRFTGVPWQSEVGALL